jgi:hypothetical protein
MNSTLPRCVAGHRARAMPLAERLEYSSIPVTESGCLLWFGASQDEGYGTLVRDGKYLLAHRVAWELAFGPIPDGMRVCHKCDCPPCINPAHLFLGTDADNQADCAAKGRARRGASNGRAVLTEDDVRAIRLSSDTQEILAAMYGVHQGTISDAKTGKRWRHVS